VLRKKFGPKRDDIKESGRDQTKCNFIIGTPQQILIGRSNQEG
jgi:hypothetical protein